MTTDELVLHLIDKELLGEIEDPAPVTGWTPSNIAARLERRIRDEHPEEEETIRRRIVSEAVRRLTTDGADAERMPRYVAYLALEAEFPRESMPVAETIIALAALSRTAKQVADQAAIAEVLAIYGEKQDKGRVAFRAICDLLLQSRDIGVQRVAAKALIRYPRGTAILTAVLVDPARDLRVRRNCALALARMRATKARSAAEGFLRNAMATTTPEERELVIALLLLLGAVGGKSSLAVVPPYQESPHRAIADCARNVSDDIRARVRSVVQVLRAMKRILGFKPRNRLKR